MAYYFINIDYIAFLWVRNRDEIGPVQAGHSII